MDMALQMDLNMPFIFFGPQLSIFTLFNHMQTHDIRKTQKVRTIWIHVDDPGHFGAKEEFASNITLQALLVTNAPRLPVSRDHITLHHVGMAAEVYDYLLHLLGISSAMHTRNAVFVPNKARSIRSQQNIIAELNAKLGDWAILLGTLENIADLGSMLGGIQRELNKFLDTSAEPDSERLQREHVHRLLRNGDTLTRDNFFREKSEQEKECKIRERMDLEEKMRELRKKEKEEEEAASQAPPVETSGTGSQRAPQQKASPAKRPRPAAGLPKPPTAPKKKKTEQPSPPAAERAVSSRDVVAKPQPGHVPEPSADSSTSSPAKKPAPKRQRPPWTPTTPAAEAATGTVAPPPLGAPADLVFEDDEFPDA